MGVIGFLEKGEGDRQERRNQQDTWDRPRHRAPGQGPVYPWSPVKRPHPSPPAGISTCQKTRGRGFGSDGSGSGEFRQDSVQFDWIRSVSVTYSHV